MQAERDTLGTVQPTYIRNRLVRSARLLDVHLQRLVVVFIAIYASSSTRGARSGGVGFASRRDGIVRVSEEVVHRGLL